MLSESAEAEEGGCRILQIGEREEFGAGNRSFAASAVIFFELTKCCNSSCWVSQLWFR